MTPPRRAPAPGTAAWLLALLALRLRLVLGLAAGVVGLARTAQKTVLLGEEAEQQHPGDGSWQPHRDCRVGPRRVGALPLRGRGAEGEANERCYNGAARCRCVMWPTSVLDWRRR
eukprot:CAMPEP_0176234124 /NCGR_PEP_ID=MMETSP0121_2-20121125/26175_1 /TAXON_ID=160619 /ORGANISM="Kryptoperidinium foliaceum, Strain CCMP 1326" /LENGTH=114 /DNA_ID=CAMNT_0017573533 /DNA_START=198 /DNA_END=542 /DNA_ORIENTATION=+